MNFSLNLPINGVSFGQVSTLILRELYKRELEPSLFPIGQVDLSSQSQDQGFFAWIQKCINKAKTAHSRDNPTLKLWHFNGGLDSFSRRHALLTFYELDQPTLAEVNAAKNVDKLIFTNKYTQDIFSKCGVDSEVVPLAFDKYNFNKKDKKYFDDDRISFILCGKFEHRKNHAKTIKAWAKKYGNDKKYFLQCCVYNPFADEQTNKRWFAESLGGEQYFNIQFLGNMPQNELYNDFLNSADVVLGMSGGEGWGLPEFQAVALGAHAVILNCTAYKEWANDSNSVIVEPSGKKEAYDGVFFKKGDAWNQGKIFDYGEDQFTKACDQVIERVNNDRCNHKGLELTQEFNSEKLADNILKILVDLET